MTIDAIISAFTGLLATAVGAGIVWGVTRAKVDMLFSSFDEFKRINREDHGNLWDGLTETERRCKERDGRIERDLATTTSRLNGHLDAISMRGPQ